MQALKITKGKAYCFDPKYKKYMLMGNVIGAAFFKKVQSKHFMRVVNGYGLQYDAFVQFEANGINEVRILEDTGATWLSKPKDWIEHGKIADYGRGKQIFLSLKFMRLKNKEQEQVKAEQKERDRAQIKQNRLW